MLNNHFENLESRRLMSTTLLPNGELRIDGTDRVDNVLITQSGGNLFVRENGRSRTFDVSNVSKIVVDSKTGNDIIKAAQSVTRRMIVRAGRGDDTVTGGSRADAIFGGPGRDVLRGGGGNDRVWGQNDDDWLEGNAYNDSLYAGRGDDTLLGGSGNDVLVSVGGGVRDALDGGSGIDNFWCDVNPTETVTDTEAPGVSSRGLHRIPEFLESVSQEPDGQDLPDPKLNSPQSAYRNFRDVPLFGPDGPQESDVRQGAADSSFLLSPLAALAKAHPSFLRNRITDLGDGTFAVHFIRNPVTSVYVRVDADLAQSIYEPSKLSNAALGASGSAWVAVIEKAACVFLGSGAPDYSVLSSSEIGANGGFEMLGAGSSPITASSPSGALRETRAAILRGQLPTWSFANQLGGMPPGHVWQVQDVKTIPVWIPTGGGPLGTGGYFRHIPVSVTLRNPRGYDALGEDSNPADGIVTLTSEQITKLGQPTMIGGWSD
ncbi:MAG: hypothetical protein ACREJC_04625 [Tepidisphaeraceae bacterium]